MFHLIARLTIALLLLVSFWRGRRAWRSLSTLVAKGACASLKLALDSVAGGYGVLKVEMYKEFIIHHADMEIDLLLLLVLLLRFTLPPFLRRFPACRGFVVFAGDVAGRLSVCIVLDVGMLWLYSSGFIGRMGAQ
ncbi:MAG: hypothetical protein ACR2M1_06045 [Gemmatimonadaceae bacterium]